MRTGTLRNRITIQKKAVVYDRFHSPIEGKELWSDYVKIWASFKGLRGSEYFASQQLQNKNYIRMYVRYRADITVDMRILHGTTIYNIESITPSNNKDYLEMLCVERSSEQDDDNE